VERAQAAIEAIDLAKDYGAFVAVSDVSFTVPRGQVVALLGPNGAGKSTTMKMLTGYIAPTAGTARILGCDIRTERLSAIAKIGYLPENGPLYPDMTPAQLLYFFGRARGLTRTGVEARLRDVVTQLDLQHLLEKPINKLSKGLRQRVALAQALLHDPDILIMDEPTAGLDPNQIRQFRTLVNQLRGQKTLLLSTHILQEVEALAERVLLIHGGRLVFDGTPADMSKLAPLEDAFYALTQAPREATEPSLEWP
jgi:ABC-2 type transport system ATP-binding protein